MSLNTGDQNRVRPRTLQNHRDGSAARMRRRRSVSFAFPSPCALESRLLLATSVSAIENLAGAIGRAVIDYDPAAGPARLRDHRHQQPREKPLLVARWRYGDIVFHA